MKNLTLSEWAVAYALGMTLLLLGQFTDTRSLVAVSSLWLAALSIERTVNVYRARRTRR